MTILAKVSKFSQANQKSQCCQYKISENRQAFVKNRQKNRQSLTKVANVANRKNPYFAKVHKLFRFHMGALFSNNYSEVSDKLYILKPGCLG